MYWVRGRRTRGRREAINVSDRSLILNERKLIISEGLINVCLTKPPIALYVTE